MAEMKFLHQVVDDVADLQEMALVLAQQIAGNAPLALRAAKIVKLELAAGRTSEALQQAEAVRRKLDGTQDCLEELVAFAEKPRSRIYRRIIVFLCKFMHLNVIYLLLLDILRQISHE